MRKFLSRFLIDINVFFFFNLRILPCVSEKNMHSARHRRQSNQKRMMDNKKKNLLYKIPLRTPPARRALQRVGFSGGGNKSNDNFFSSSDRNDFGVWGFGTSTSGWREGESRKRGWVSCERIHAVEFCILSLAACGLKQHPPTHRNSHYAKECTRE